jgi:hypothetical protein
LTIADFEPAASVFDLRDRAKHTTFHRKTDIRVSGTGYFQVFIIEGIDPQS